MPRGIYDRSKLKKNHKHDSTETVAHTAAPKNKPGRKPGSKNKMKQEAAPASLNAKGMAAPDFGTISMLSEVRQNLATLAALKDRGFTIPAITTEITAQVAVLGRLSREAFGEEQVDTKTETAAPSNGVTVPAVTPVQVPLPPNVTVALPTQS